MAYETNTAAETIDPKTVLLMLRMGHGRFTVPVGDWQVNCLVLRVVGVRAALGPAAGRERCMVAVPDENIVDFLETSLAAAHRSFPDRVRGLRLTRDGIDSPHRPDRPWIKLSHCGIAAHDPDGTVTAACCPSIVCKAMVPLVDGALAAHTTNPEFTDGGPCGWSGVGVVDDRSDWLPADDGAAPTRPDR